MSILFRVLLVAALLASAAVAQEKPRIMPSPNPAIEPTHADVVYRTTPILELRADVYLPEAASPTVAIAWFHPGGFRQRNKRWMRNAIFDQYAEGVAIVSFEYTLAQEAKWPAQAHDGKAAIRWLRSRAREYNIDPGRIFVGGSSAGAMLANIVANSSGAASLREPDAKNSDYSDAVSGVISFYPAADMTRHSGWPDENSSGTFLTGCADRSCIDEVKSASPLYWVSKESPPALLFHGLDDVVIDYRQSVMLQERYNEVGGRADLVLRSGLVHGDVDFDQPAMRYLVTRFLRAQ